MDIADKHVVLIPSLAAVGLKDFVLMNGKEVMMQNINLVLVNFEEGAGFMRFPIDVKVEIKGNPNVALEIVLGKGQPFEFEPLIPTLHQLVDLVDGIIKTFEAHFK
jgi:hypothetical protein